MSKEACYLCGRDPAAGYATIYKDGVDKRYCHGDDDDMSCYETQVIGNALRGSDEETTFN